MEADNQSVPDTLETKLAAMECHLCDIRADVSKILNMLRDELEQFREREFWQEYRETYNQE
ncbi:hypothetical protein PDESU_02440 [Pontiella desulfatans]|uniref:Uncharacterized protein n=1 Tax=Pontiella desulfatans TaxID=2750659 RepID=A0A6C2U1X1_PONDE|nr:hypothetical protein [Pontiella desulfatans]VGO13883.1 hypothetical protein PDESU_02440 [Pontiella desulfatans]